MISERHESESAALAAARLTLRYGRVARHRRSDARPCERIRPSLPSSIQLHMAIATASGNSLMQYVTESMRQPIADIIERGLARMKERRDSTKKLVADHAAVVDAICSGGPVAARAAASRRATSALSGFRNRETPAKLADLLAAPWLLMQGGR